MQGQGIGKLGDALRHCVADPLPFLGKGSVRIEVDGLSDVKLVKPGREIYDLLCSKFSLKPEECVFIDDSAANIEGAEVAGMSGIVFHGEADEAREKLRALGVNV